MTSTVIAMTIFVLVGLLTIVLGLYLAGSHISQNISTMHYSFVSVHIILGIFGFATIIIMGVSFQVIPMFYVAKDFPKFIQHKIPFTLVFLIFLYTVFEFLGFDKSFIELFLVLSIISFAYFGINSF